MAKISLLNIKMISRHQISYLSLTGNAFFLLSLCGMRFGGLKSILLFTLPFLPPSASSLNCNLNSSIPPDRISHQKTRIHIGYRVFKYSLSTNNHSFQYRKRRTADRNDIRCRFSPIWANAASTACWRLWKGTMFAFSTSLSSISVTR